MARKQGPTPPNRFGEAAVEFGYCTSRDVDRGLKVQSYRRAKGDPIPLLGEALRDLGVLRQEQVEAVFEFLVTGERPAPPPARVLRQQPKKKPASSWWARLLGRESA